MTAEVTTQPRLRLLRYFSLTSLVGVAVVLAVLLFFYRYLAFHALAAHETRNNEMVTQVFANTLWPRHAAYVRSAGAKSAADLRRSPETAQIRDDVLRQMRGLNIVKVKIYNLDGLTVFSTDEKQIGMDESTNAGFLKARAGQSASDITFRDHFDAFERVINDRNLVSSYVPIRVDADSRVDGVMEVYSDVTDYVLELQRTTWQIVAGVLGCLGLLYFFLYAIVRRADQIISAQREDVRRANEAVIKHQASHDELTGLPNRDHFLDYLADMIASPARGGDKCAVLRLDLDGLKEINDSLGHGAGDQLLKQVSARLKNSLREVEISARIGGGEFAIVLTGISEARGIEQIALAAERIGGIISQEAFVIDGHKLSLTASIGIATYPDDGADVTGLMMNAGAALHHAKTMGRNTYQFHLAEMNARAMNMLLMEGELRRALAEGQFLLHYQPQVNVETGLVSGVEALIRWRHPERGLLLPAQFIPIAEERGLINEIGAWVIGEACRQNRQWQEAGLPAVVIAVNLSALQFHQQDVSQVVADVLRDCGLAPEYLEIEMTESSLMRDAGETIATMERLKATGVRLSLDDFGTGYSSLSQLKHLPLDKLKIDQSFVRGLPDDQDDMAISRAIVGLGKAMGLVVIAEGVETQAQADTLRELGCDDLQGYFVASPAPAEQFVQFMRDRAAAIVARQ